MNAPFVRTVTGDVSSRELGICYAHEHFWLDSPHLRTSHPDLLLADFNLLLDELRALRPLGVGWAVDAMPGRSGRNGVRLRDLSFESDLRVVASTGVHLDMYYDQDEPLLRFDRDALAQFFVQEIQQGTEESREYAEPVRSGCIKLASGGKHLTSAERERFAAGAIAQSETGCPILTHTENGEAAVEQVEILVEHGAQTKSIILSHLDRKPDTTYIREVLSTGVTLEFDSCFRWNKSKTDREGYGPEPGKNPTLDLFVELLPEFPNQFVVGMDAAKSSYWKSYGGEPGLAFLLEQFVPLLQQRGLEQELIDQLLSENPARAYSFSSPNRNAPF